MATENLDPLLTLLSDHTWRGAALYIGWKVANKALAIWKDTNVMRITSEAERHKVLAESLDRLSSTVNRNTIVTRKQSGSLRHLFQLVTEWGRPSKEGS